MSSVQVITTIVVLLASLVCYAFIAQTIKAKKAQRERMLALLRRRNKTFKFMLNGFPAGFLSKELTLLVQNSLIETLDQLVKLDRQDAAHAQDLQILSKQVSETQRLTGPQTNTKLINPQQIKEVKICLEELNKFVHSQEKRGAIPRNKADNFRSQIKQLALRVTVDAYELQGQASIQNAKTKLAHHYYTLACKLLIREGKGEDKNARVNEYKQILQKLSEKLKEETPEDNPSPPEDKNTEQLGDQWDTFNQTDESWKKNTVYD